MKFFKTNWLKKHWFKLVSAAVFVFLCVYVPLVAVKKAKDYEIYKEPIIDTRIYTIWHIETFEGGSKSRLTFLKSIARKIESENKGVLIMIKQIEPDKLESELNEGAPDIFSFGFGVGKLILPSLAELNSAFNVRDEFVESGSFNKQLFALPYIVSGYAEFSHGGQVKNYYCGENEYIHPEKIYSALNYALTERQSQYEAYKDFIYDDESKLIGSARDVFRVSNLNAVGRASASITPIDSYTDLIQYIGIKTNDEITNKFLAMALDDEHQRSLVDYGLFSSKYPKIYSSGIYDIMENALYSATIPNVFE